MRAADNNIKNNINIVTFYIYDIINASLRNLRYEEFNEDVYFKKFGYLFFAL